MQNYSHLTSCDVAAKAIQLHHMTRSSRLWLSSAMGTRLNIAASSSEPLPPSPYVRMSITVLGFYFGLS